MPELNTAVTAPGFKLTAQMDIHKKKLFFDKRARAWDRDHSCPVEDARVDGIVPFFGLGPGLRVLDIGCGTGKLVPRLLEGIGGSGWVVEADLSIEMLRVGRKKIPEDRVRFVQMDARFPALRAGTFDRVICFSAFPHVGDQAGALLEFFQALKAGGRLVIAHTMGREELNAYLRWVGDPVGNDGLPDNAVMAAMLSWAGFHEPEIIDRPHCYIAGAWA